MIPFKCSKRDKTRTPILYNEDIWEYAEALIGDYKPSLLKEPAPLNVEHFLESYLGATIDYQDIFFAKGEDPIAGATVFNDDHIRVFDREGMCTRVIKVAAGTIIIDNSTVAAGNKGFEAFTGLHEGGHFTMHQEVYRHNPSQISFFEAPKDGSNLVCCRKSTMFGKSRWSARQLTPEQNREHQANTFAAFAAMPRQTFVPLAQSLICGAGFRNGVFVYDDKHWESDYALEQICNELVRAFGTSFTAVKIHLKELGLLLNVYQFENRTSQATVSM